MSGKLCILLISLSWSIVSSDSTLQQSSTISISSALALNDGYLLLFTADGFVISSEVGSWCHDSICPMVLTSSGSPNQQPNMSALSDLWNGTRVLGLERVDASALLQHGSFAWPSDYLLLIQQDPASAASAGDLEDESADGLKYLVVQLPSRRIVSFGNGLSLFGQYLSLMPCLANIVDLVVEKSHDETTTKSSNQGHLDLTSADLRTSASTTTNYIVCRESDGSLTLVQGTLDSTRFHYTSLQVVEPAVAGSKAGTSFPLALIQSLRQLYSKSSYSREGNLVLSFTQLNTKGGQLVVFESRQNMTSSSSSGSKMTLLLSTFGVYKHVWSGPVETVIRMPSSVWPGRRTALKVESYNASSANNSSSDSGKMFKEAAAIFEWAQFALILYTFAFLLGTFHLLLVGTEKLSDYLHDGHSLLEWRHKGEPVWMSEYDPPVHPTAVLELSSAAALPPAL